MLKKQPLQEQQKPVNDIHFDLSMKFLDDLTKLVSRSINVMKCEVKIEIVMGTIMTGLSVTLMELACDISGDPHLAIEYVEHVVKKYKKLYDGKPHAPSRD
ncbi:MAG: hypothetical protein ACREBU_02650 [Nitrososphaera sp.]